MPDADAQKLPAALHIAKRFKRFESFERSRPKTVPIVPALRYGPFDTRLALLRSLLRTDGIF